jgi:transitional endoplasmic reticulum ATPase
MEKPILHNWFSLAGGIAISQRVDRLFSTDVYKLSDNRFLYLFLDIVENDILNSDIEILKIKNWNKTYVWVIVDTFNIKFLSSLKEKLTSVSGFRSVAWMDVVKQKLFNEIITPFRNKEQFKRYKLSLPNGLLFFWPPGCWKTYISGKLAEELGWNFIEVKHSSIASTYIHWTVDKIGQLFEKAKLKAPVVLFIDELSWLVPKRENIRSDNQHKEEEVNEFLINLDDASEKGILVVGATNYPNRIDPAVLRSGRFDLKVYIWPPDADTRSKLFSFYLNWRPISTDINYEELTELTKDYIISDIEFIIESAAKKSALQNVPISQEILVSCIKSIPKSISDNELSYYDSLFGEKQENTRKIGFDIE